jgi:drug/metabolite transporter (DMT)-like permease
MIKNPHLRGSTYAFVGIFILCFDPLLVRLAHAPSATVLFWRGLFIGLALTFYSIIKDKRSPLEVIKEHPRQYLCAGLLFALASCGFILSLKSTTVANTAVILSTAPLFSALASYLMNKEQVKRHTIIAMLVMVVGTIIIVSSSIGSGRLSGDLLAVCAAASVGIGQAYMRGHNSLQRTTIIMLNGYYLALFSIFFADLTPAPASLSVLAIMGLLEMPIAMVLFTTATRFISAAEASMFMIFESVLGPFFVFIFLGEIAPINTIYGGVLIFTALFINTWLSSKAAHTTRLLTT